MGHKNRRINIAVIIALLMLVIVSVAGIGNVTIPFSEFFKILGSRLPFFSGLVDSSDIPRSHFTIIYNLRLPRILLSMFAGFGLAYSGVVYQGVFKNPMAEPYLLGVSSGAALGATIASILPVSIWFLGFSYTSMLAFAGSLMVLTMIFGLTGSSRRNSINILLLAGLALNYFISSIISLLMMFNYDKIADVYFWTMGTFKTATYEKIMVVAMVVLIGVAYTYPKYRALDIMLLGDDQAKSLGINVNRMKKSLLVSTSLMTAVIVASCGIVGFVGLIIPHLVRLLIGPMHKKLLIHSMLFGGVFLILADTVARSILPNQELSVGIITAILGVPVFVWMLIKRRTNI